MPMPVKIKILERKFNLKKFLSLTLIFFVFSASVALAKKPVRIARLPIIVQSNKLDAETAAALETKFSRAVKIPLNQTLQIAEYIPPSESETVLKQIWQDMYAQNKHSKIADAVKIFADEINADLVVCPVLRRYSQSISQMSFSFETRLSSNVSAELIVYDKTANNLIDKKTYRRFNDSYIRFGTKSYLAGECFDQLIKETGLRKIIQSMKG